VDRPAVFVVSDSIGETAELVARGAMSQFEEEFEVVRAPYISDRDHLLEVIERAHTRGSCAIVHTLLLPELREAMAVEAAARDIPQVDLFGPTLAALARVAGGAPRMETGLFRRVDEDYYRRIEAVEFAVDHDDGLDPRGLDRADVVLVGVSRTSKTPVSIYLANKRVKAANVPLVPEVPPPPELFKLPRGKVIGLTIDPEKLNDIRGERLEVLGLPGEAGYASRERIIEELEYAGGIMKHLGCRRIDVTGKAVEETAGAILRMIKGRETRD
jgi:hypothetical protein